METICKEDDLRGTAIPNRRAVLFYATWAPMMKQTFSLCKKMEKEFDVNFYSVDIDYLPSLKIINDIQELPTVLLIRGGKELVRIPGLVMTSAFRDAMRNTFGPARYSNLKDS